MVDGPIESWKALQLDELGRELGASPELMMALKTGYLLGFQQGLLNTVNAVIESKSNGDKLIATLDRMSNELGRQRAYIEDIGLTQLRTMMRKNG